MSKHFFDLTLVALDQGDIEGCTIHATPKIAFACEGDFWVVDFVIFI
jgi:hypothetical protein